LRERKDHKVVEWYENIKPDSPLKKDEVKSIMQSKNMHIQLVICKLQASDLN